MLAGIIVDRKALPGDPAGYRAVDLGERSFFTGSGSERSLGNPLVFTSYINLENSGNKKLIFLKFKYDLWHEVRQPVFL